jgi:hypothetical protein
LIVTVSVAVAFGATVSNMPVLIAGVNALKIAVPSTVSIDWSDRLTACAWYFSRGLVDDRHGEPAAQSWLICAGSTSVVLSVGASAKNWMLAAPVRRSNTADTSSPLASPAVSRPRSTPTTA